MGLPSRFLFNTSLVRFSMNLYDCVIHRLIPLQLNDVTCFALLLYLLYLDDGALLILCTERALSSIW